MLINKRIIESTYVREHHLTREKRQQQIQNNKIAITC